VPTDASAYADYRIDGRVAAGTAANPLPGVVGGLRMSRIAREVALVAREDLPVLVLGETGTGKEVVAQALHASSGRRGPMQALNCASIPANLVESELFGYRRGAFTGATRDHPGVIRAAHGGTLFLDEIGDMPLDTQAKLLRTLESRQIFPVGAVAPETVDVRVVGATHRDVRALVAAGTFRADLFARLNGYTLELPPLRDRKEDLFALVRHALRASGAPDRGITFGFMLALCNYEWPYNVRELLATVKRALAVSEGAPLDSAHLPREILERMEAYGAQAGVDPRASVLPPGHDRAPRPTASRLSELLELHRGNVSGVARDLGKDRALVNRWIRASGLDPDAFRRRDR
jgi:DNA-binding NtrC family response regulator